MDSVKGFYIHIATPVVGAFVGWEIYKFTNWITKRRRHKEEDFDARRYLRLE
jgi:prepilin signal peptidase PulO-like enzyme (type II secretory pathway)